MEIAIKLVSVRDGRRAHRVFLIATFQLRGDMKHVIKKTVAHIPVVGDLVRQTYWRAISRRRKPEPFPGSAAYWEMRYRNGSDSGAGSYGFFAEFKAEVLNEFVAGNNVRSVIELGCGDGNQLTLARYPRYLGFDISAAALAKCNALFASDATKSFRLTKNYAGEKADLAVSLDVIYHLVEDEVYERHMQMLFNAGDRYVIVYSSDSDDNRGYHGTHVRHRKFTRWVERLPDWRLLERVPNRYPYRGDYRKGSFADFFIYQKI